MDWSTLAVILLRVALTYLERDEDKNGIPDVLQPFLPDSASAAGKSEE